MLRLLGQQFPEHLLRFSPVVLWFALWFIIRPLGAQEPSVAPDMSFSDTVHIGTREVLRTVQKSEFTRLPLCEGDVDHVVGLVHMKDLFNHLKLVPGKLKFVDERSPDGELIAIPSGLPGSAVHVIGSGEIDLHEDFRPGAGFGCRAVAHCDHDGERRCVVEAEPHPVRGRAASESRCVWVTLRSRSGTNPMDAPTSHRGGWGP